MSLAKIIALCDQVAALIKAEWEPSEPSTVERVYQAPIAPSELDKLVGRKVFVFPSRKLSLGVADRGSDRFNWSVGVLAVERYVDAGALASKQWLDERTDWMESVVEYAVDFDGRDNNYLEFDGRQLWTLGIETEIYDVDYLDEAKMFWSTMEVVYDEIAEVP